MAIKKNKKQKEQKTQKNVLKQQKNPGAKNVFLHLYHG